MRYTLLVCTAVCSVLAACSTPPPGDFTVLDACGPVRQTCLDGNPVLEERLVIDGQCTSRTKTLGRCAASEACVEDAKECADDGCISARCIENRCAPELDCAALPTRCEGDIAITPSSNGVCNPATGRCADPDALVEFCAESGRVCLEGSCIAPEAICDPACDDDRVCRDNQCVERGACTPPCTELQACRDGRCVDAPPPACDPPCRDDQRCIAGACQDEPDEGIFSATRYATHQFVAVGDAVDLGGLGDPLDLVTDDVLTVGNDGQTATCAASGTACLRFDYGAAPGAHIQTLCVVCVAGEGDCGALPDAMLDLEPGDGVSLQEANFLASGEGALYRVCQGPAGLLVDSGAALPPLMLRIVAAYGIDEGGSVERGTEDMDLARATAFTTRSGERLTPAWHSTMGHELRGFTLEPDGTVTVDDPVCDTDAFSSAGCTHYPAAVDDDDLFTLYTGAVSPTEIDGLIRQRPDRVAALAARHGSSLWSADLSGLSEESAVRRTMVQRWLGADLFRLYALAFDRVFDLSGRGVRVAMQGNASHRRSLSSICSPEESLCDDIEAELRSAEAATLAALRDEDLNELWLHVTLRYTSGGRTALASSPPHHALFDGVVIDIDTAANPPASELPIAENLIASLDAAAQELGDLPVIVSVSAGPNAAYVDGVACEAGTCQPDFARYYLLVEAVWRAALEHFGLDRIHAFAVPLMDGDHFDIDAPREGNIHRTAETGYNNPLLNPYLTR